MNKLLIFAGTYEGRALCEFVSKKGLKATASVATDYGEAVIGNLEGIVILQGRLDEAEIQRLIHKEAFQRIVDATHPYATVVSENIRAACKATGAEYIRLLREESPYQGLISAKTIEQAVELINSIEGNVLLTTGSKELSKYKGITDFSSRVYARVLPSLESLESCLSLGLKGKQVICMQGPFSIAINKAMLEDLDCKLLVTKNTGIAGGFQEKVEAAKLTGAKVVVIQREDSYKDVGYNLDEVKAMLMGAEAQEPKRIEASLQNRHRYFPAFVDSVDKLAVVVGGGKIALGRVEKLKTFGFKIKVVSENFLYRPEGVLCIEKTFEAEDIVGAFLVVAATSKREVNHSIGQLCIEEGRLCCVADRGQEGSFIFPAILEKDNMVIGLSSDGTSPKTTKVLADRLREILI